MPFGFDQEKLDQLAALGYPTETAEECIAAIKQADGWESDDDARRALTGLVDDVVADTEVGPTETEQGLSADSQPNG